MMQSIQMHSEWQEIVNNFFFDKLRAFIHVIYIFKILTEFKSSQNMFCTEATQEQNLIFLGLWFKNHLKV